MIKLQKLCELYNDSQTLIDIFFDRREYDSEDERNENNIMLNYNYGVAQGLKEAIELFFEDEVEFYTDENYIDRVKVKAPM